MPETGVIHADPEILGGTAVLVGTSVPVKTLFDYLRGEHTVGKFLDDFPGVTRKRVTLALHEAEEALMKLYIGTGLRDDCNFRPET